MKEKNSYKELIEFFLEIIIILVLSAAAFALINALIF
jgi:hypothetical protein